MVKRDPDDSVELIEIYGEYVKPADLLVSLAETLVLGALAYFIAPYLLKTLGVPKDTIASLTITLGLIGASIGFFVTLAFIKPKRVVEGG